MNKRVLIHCVLRADMTANDFESDKIECQKFEEKISINGKMVFYSWQESSHYGTNCSFCGKKYFSRAVAVYFVGFMN
jgi:hypothetical protein